MTVAATPLNATYAADPLHSWFGFAVLYMGVGLYRGLLGDVDAKLSGGRLDGSANVASISIDHPEQMRSTLLGPDFFDEEHFPEIRFASTRLDLRDDGSAEVSGELTMKGITRPIDGSGRWTEATPDAFGLTRGHLQLKATIDRAAFDMGFNLPLPSGGKALGDEVALTIELSLLEQT